MRCHVAGCVNEVEMGQVCQDCWDGRIQLRASLPELWLRLHSRLPKGGQGPSEGLSRPRPGSRPPLQIHILDTLRRVPYQLAGWANACLATTGPMITDARRAGHVLTEAVHVLQCEDETLHYTHVAGEYLAALAWLHRHMTLLIGLEPVVTRLATPCPACDQHVVPLYRDARRAAVTCTVCGSVSPDAVWIGRLLREAQ